MDNRTRFGSVLFLMPDEIPLLRKMAPADLDAIAALGIRSKAHWGYSATEMATFAQELTLDAGDLAALLDARVACLDAQIVGYVTLRTHPDDSVELEHLFVAPERFGERIGSLLLRAAMQTAGETGAASLTIFSDPNATGFYLKQGATQVGEHQSSIPGRTIPILSLPVSGRL